MPDRKLVPVSSQTLVRIFEKDGFSLARQEGDHKIFTKAGVLRPLVPAGAGDHGVVERVGVAGRESGLTILLPDTVQRLESRF